MTTPWPAAWGPAPAPDDRTSPLTGYTREHWVAAADGLLHAAARYASPGGARIPLPGPPSWNGPDCDGLEGYARTFLLLGWRLSGTGEADEELVERYTAGLVAGTDPGHPEAWPRITLEDKQTVVEAASVALALHETRARIWDRLTDGERDRVIDWLLGVFAVPVPDNNWHWFRVVVATFAESAGYRLTAAQHEVVEADLARLEEFSVGDGWYRDGAGGGDRFDHYAGWAMQFYPVLWHRMCATLDPGSRLARAAAALRPAHRERMAQFLGDYVDLVGADGAPLFLGRSLTYRWAAAAAPVAAVLDGTSPCPPGQVRHLASAMLRYFLDRGAIGPDGVPSLGWFGPYRPMIQGYSAPASPFWLSKAFVCLLVDPADPFWTAAEEPLPAAQPAPARTLAAPGLVVSAADGVVRVANHGTDHHRPGAPGDPLYTRLAYSTATAPVLGAGAHVVPDNHVGLVRSGPAAGAQVSRRTRIHRLPAPDGAAASWHTPVWGDDAGAVTPEPGARVVTVSVLDGPWELRVHRVDAGAALAVRDSGWAVAGDEPPVVEHVAGGVRVTGRDGLTGVLVPLLGHDGEPEVADAGEGAFGPHVRVPSVTTARDAGTTVHAVLVGLGRTGLELDRAPRVVVEGTDRVRVTLSSGVSRTVALPGPAR